MTLTPSRWIAIPALCALAAMLGCQGVSSGKNVGTQQGAQLTAGPTSLNFTNVQTGTSQSQTVVLGNSGGSSLTVTQAVVSGAGFSTSGLSLPLMLGAGQTSSFQVVFSPTATGSVTGSLNLSWGSTSPVTVTLSGSAIAPGSLNTNPTSFNFGNVPVGGLQSQVETVTNVGGSSVTIETIGATGDFSASGPLLPVTLASNQSINVNVSFSPPTVGPTTGTLGITINGSNTPIDVALSGTGVTAGTLTPSPASLTFTNVVVGQTSNQTETLQNTGGTNVSITTVVASGTGVSVSGFNPGTLTPGQSTSFTVSFAPQSAGTINGNVTVTSNATNSPLSIPVSATAVTPATITPSPTSVTFSGITVGQNSTQSVSLKNTGGANTTISAASVSGTGFTISGITPPVTLTPGQSTSLNVVFTPQSVGTFTGNVTITSDASNPSLAIPLTGTSVAATQATLSVTSTIPVGSVGVGGSGSATGTLTASGGSVVVSSVTIGGTNASEFTVTGLTFPVTVTTATPVNFTVNFLPTAAGAATATASFASNASNSPSVASLTGTGVAGTLSATSTVAVGNVGIGGSGTATGTLTASGGTVTVSSVTIGGTNASEFSVTGLTFPVTVTTATPVNFTVKFSPTATGAATATASFASNASNSPSVANLTGTGVAGTLGVTSTIAVGSVVEGQSGTATGTLTATGGTVSVASVTIGGSNASEFTVTGLTFPVTVTTATPVNFTVKFSPTATGAATATASFASNASNSPSVANLTGTGVAATLSVTSTIAVGTVVVGQSGTATGTLTATGGTVSVSSVTIGGTNASEFTVTGLTFPVTVTTATPVNFTVNFSPSATGAATATASFASNAGNSPSVANLTGTGQAAPGSLSVTTPIAVGSVVVGLDGTATGTLTATGGSVSVTSVTIGGTNPTEFTVTGLTFPVTVTTTTPVNFTVTFTPGAAGAASATASFASNASNSPTVASLTGTGTAAPVHTVLLQWTGSTTTGITSYNVYRVILANGVCPAFGSTPYASTGGSTTSYTDELVTDGDTYCYGTTAVDASGESAMSNIAQAQIPAP